MAHGQALPNTWQAIKAAFPGRDNKGLRDGLWRIAKATGSVKALAQTTAFTELGRAKLTTIDAVLAEEWQRD